MIATAPSRRAPPRRACVLVRGAALAAAALLLTGCGSLQRTDSLLGLITPYRIDIVQGNVITKEQAERVRPGMSRLQVRDLLGTPLLTDPFHAARWDYLFTMRRPGTDAQARHVVVHFDGDQVARIDAPELPTEREFERWLTQDAGFSRRQARALIRDGFNGLNSLRDAGQAESWETRLAGQLAEATLLLTGPFKESGR